LGEQVLLAELVSLLPYTSTKKYIEKYILQNYESFWKIGWNQFTSWVSAFRNYTN